MERQPKGSWHLIKPVALVYALTMLPGALHAQRQPVLQQIKVPHSYYYREMYLPQLTSGPSSVTWSPDGQELIYSMQGSLWRQRIGTDEARQLTAGPGYDYQPDWSPDGSRVVYASYLKDAVELRLLDLRSGETRSFVSNRAVNVEPRWSPQGNQVAYVSSEYQGRWHIFIAHLGRGDSISSERVTEDRASGLPRYYYGAYDQYLSPTWSADGKELILISNRGHIWGSGGFWRMPAAPGSQARELHYEETTWKARPDWSRDGKRVAYSSYLGNQWNQLWLMTSDGGDPFQLTYGEGDATAPRWSPDGTRIAFISNAGGNTGLRIVHVPGGAIDSVRPGVRRYLADTGRLRLTVLDQATRRQVPARVSVTGADGRSYGPDDAWLHADDSYDRTERNFEYGYFHAGGTALIRVPAGKVELEVSRGPEYRVQRRSLQVTPGSTVAVTVDLERLANLPADGWYGGDLHVHMNYGGTYRNTPARLARQARAEDLHLVENLIVNKEGRIPDLAWFKAPDSVSSATTVVAHDQEFHTSYWGHIGLLGLTRNILLPAYSAYVNTAAASLYPTNAAIMDLAHQQGAITGYVHPFDSDPDPSDSTKPLTNELPVDVALGKVDYYEALGFVDDYEATAKVWYKLLNCGFRLPAGAGTDAMANFASLRGPIGMNRVYVRSGSPLNRRRFLTALKAGRSFATNGPLLGFTVGGKDLGQELRLPNGTREVRAEVTLRSFVPVDRLEVVRNGEVVSRIALSGERTRINTTVTLPVEGSGWYLLRARANQAEYPVLDVYPYATTSPIYVTVGGKPIRSATDAGYFISWLDRLRQGALAHRDWNSEAEKSGTLDLIARARQEFQRRAGQ